MHWDCTAKIARVPHPCALCKGGRRCCRRCVICGGGVIKPVRCIHSRLPPLQRTQERDTRCGGDARQIEGRAIRPIGSEKSSFRPTGHRLKNNKVSSQKKANMARARKRCGQDPPFVGLSPALICLIFLTRIIFPTAKHVPLPIRNNGSGVLPGSVYPAKMRPPSIPSSMNRIVDFFTRKLLLRTHAARNRGTGAPSLRSLQEPALNLPKGWAAMLPTRFLFVLHYPLCIASSYPPFAKYAKHGASSAMVASAV